MLMMMMVLYGQGINKCTKIHDSVKNGNPFNSCWDIWAQSTNMKVTTEQVSAHHLATMNVSMKFHDDASNIRLAHSNLSGLEPQTLVFFFLFFFRHGSSVLECLIWRRQVSSSILGTGRSRCHAAAHITWPIFAERRSNQQHSPGVPEMEHTPRSPRGQTAITAQEIQSSTSLEAKCKI